MKIPNVFIPDKDLDTKIEYMKKEPTKKRKQKPLHSNELSRLEKEINKLEGELKECEDRKIKHPDYYSVLTDPYREEREVTIKLIELRLKYLEKKENN